MADPVGIVGCKAWWDFSVAAANLWQESTRTVAVSADGNPIGGVTDKSGLGKHLSQNSTPNMPLYKTGIINGKSVARFDGVDDWLTATFAADTSWTLFFVAQKRATVSGEDTLFSMQTAVKLHCTTTNEFKYYASSPTATVSMGGNALSVNVVALRITSASMMNTWVNGGPGNTFDPSDAATTATVYEVGRSFGGGAGHGDFDIGEIIAYDSDLSAADMDAVGGYLAAKWATTWTPVQADPVGVPGCKAWWDFSAVSSLYQDTTFTTAVSADAQTIGAVIDKSGSARHLVQANATSEPAYKTNILNGKSVARFDGSDDFLQATTLADTSWTFFIVAKKRSAPTSTGQALLNLGSSGGEFRTHTSTGPGWCWNVNSGAVGQSLGGTPTDTNVIAMRFKEPGGSGPADVFINGMATFVSFIPQESGATTGLAVGLGSGLGGGTSWGDYDIGEVVMYDWYLDSASIEAVGQYLSAKWGVTWTASTGPVDVAGCKVWWDFSDISSLYQDVARTTAVTTNGHLILGVTDKSGNGNHASQATSSSAPTYTTSIINGKSIARFDGSADLLSATVTADTSWTFFIVAQKRGALTTSHQCLFALGNASNVFTDSSGEATTTGYNWDETQSLASTVIGGIPANVTIIAGRITAATVMDVWANGTHGGAGSTQFNPADEVTTSSTWVLGAQTVAQGFTGDYDVAEVIAYNTALSNADLDIVGAYLEAKWGASWLTAGPPVPMPHTLTLRGWWDFSELKSLWKDGAATNPVTADGDAILRIDDLSGRGFFLQQGTAANQPLYKAGIFNGRSVGRFDGSNDFMSISPSTLSQGTIFVVAKKRSAASTTLMTLWSFGADARVSVDTDLGAGFLYEQAAVPLTVSLGGTVTDVNIITIRWWSTIAMDAFINAGPQLTFDPSSTIAAGNTFYVGSTNTTTAFGDFDIGELLVFEFALTETYRKEVYDYLDNKWSNPNASVTPAAVARSATVGAPTVVAEGYPALVASGYQLQPSVPR